MTAKKVAESIAQNTVPIPVSVSGLTWLGVTLQDWVFVGTGILLLFQLIVILPKVLTIIQRFIRVFRKRKDIKDIYDGKSE